MVFKSPKELKSLYPDVKISTQFLTGQEVHIKKLLQIFDEMDGVAIDKSLPGSGKTYTTCHLAKKLNARLLVIGPKSLRIKWYRTACSFEIPIAYINLDKIRGEKSPLVTMVDKEYQAIPNLAEKLGTEPILLVYEECFHLKNRSKQSLACIALTQGMKAQLKDQVKIILLSATINDNRNKISLTMAIMGIISTPDLYYSSRGKNQCCLRFEGQDYGLKQLYDYCYRINPIITEKYSPFKTKLTKNLAMSLAYNLYREIVSNIISSEIICPRTTECKTYNYFAKIDKSSDFNKACDLLNQIIEQKKLMGKGSKDDLKNVIACLETMGMDKVAPAVRLVNTYLESNPKLKVVISIRFLKVIAKLKDALLKWKPLVYNGTLTEIEREAVRNAFQTDPTHRLLIMNPQVGGEGIDLDDQVGDSPRVMIIFPDFDLNLHYQASCRIHRLQVTKSSSLVIFLFGQYSDKIVSLEHRIISSLNGKSSIIREIRHDADESRLILPDSSEDWYE